MTHDPLHDACIAGDIGAVEIFLDGGFPVTASDRDGARPLHCAAQRGNIELSSLLLHRGARINACDKRGVTALWAAHWAGQTEMAAFLRRHGSKALCYPTSKRRTLLHKAALGSKKIARLIGEMIIDTCREAGTMVPLDIPAIVGDIPWLERLVHEGGSLDPDEELCSSPLYWAAIQGQAAALETLLRHGADPDIPTPGRVGRVPLHDAAWRGREHMVVLLLAYHATADARDRKGRTPLHSAARAGENKILQRLLAAGADVNARDRKGSTPLHSAACMGQKRVVEPLLDAGADVDARDRQGWTPLQKAASARPRVHVAFVRVLLGRGADVNSRTNDGQTVLDMAADGDALPKGDALVSLLLAYDAARGTSAGW